MWRHVWKRLADHRDAPEDLFCELFRELNAALVQPHDVATELADIVDDPARARVVFRRIRPSALRGEVALVEFLERAHSAIIEFGVNEFENRYFVLTTRFIETFNLRYDLRRPFSLHPTLAGVFSRLMRDLSQLTSADAALAPLMRDFEDAIRDLKTERTPRRIKACIHSQITLLEALAQRFPGVEADTLGRMCNQIDSWPHATVRTAMSSLYGFASNYPGIRHAGNPAGAMREIDMRDMVAVTIMLAGFTPYLSTMLSADDIYLEHA